MAAAAPAASSDRALLNAVVKGYPETLTHAISVAFSSRGNYEGAELAEFDREISRAQGIWISEVMKEEIKHGHSPLDIDELRRAVRRWKDARGICPEFASRFAKACYELGPMIEALGDDERLNDPGFLYDAAIHATILFHRKAARDGAEEKEKDEVDRRENQDDKADRVDATHAASSADPGDKESTHERKEPSVPADADDDHLEKHLRDLFVCWEKIAQHRVRTTGSRGVPRVQELALIFSQAAELDKDAPDRLARTAYDCCNTYQQSLCELWAAWKLDKGTIDRCTTLADILSASFKAGLQASGGTGTEDRDEQAPAAAAAAGAPQVVGPFGELPIEAQHEGRHRAENHFFQALEALGRQHEALDAQMAMHMWDQAVLPPHAQEGGYFPRGGLRMYPPPPPAMFAGMMAAVGAAPGMPGNALTYALGAAGLRELQNQPFSMECPRDFIKAAWCQCMAQEARRYGQWGAHPRAVDSMLRRYSQGLEMGVEPQALVCAASTENLVALIREAAMRASAQRGGDGGGSGAGDADAGGAEQVPEGLVAGAVDVLQQRLTAPKSAAHTLALVSVSQEAQRKLGLLARDADGESDAQKALADAVELACSELVGRTTVQLISIAQEGRAPERLRDAARATAESRLMNMTACVRAIDSVVASAPRDGAGQLEDRTLEALHEELTDFVYGETLDDWDLAMSSHYPGCQNTKEALLDEDNIHTGAGTHYGASWITATFREPVTVAFVAVGPCDFGGWGAEYIHGQIIEGSMDGQEWTVVGNTGSVHPRRAKRVQLENRVTYTSFRIRSAMNNYLGTSSLRFYAGHALDRKQCQKLGMAIMKALEPREKQLECGPQPLRQIVEELRAACGQTPEVLRVYERTIQELEQVLRDPADDWTLLMSSRYEYRMENSQEALLDEFDNHTGAGTTYIKGDFIQATFAQNVAVKMIAVSPYVDGGWGCTYLSKVPIEASFDGKVWFPVATTGEVPAHGVKHVWFPEPLAFKYWRLHGSAAGKAIIATAGFRFYGAGGHSRVHALRACTEEDTRRTLRSVCSRALRATDVTSLRAITAHAKAIDLQDSVIDAAEALLRDTDRSLLDPRDGWKLSMSSQYRFGLQNTQPSLTDDLTITGAGVDHGYNQFIAAEFPEPVPVKAVAVATYSEGGWGSYYLQDAVLQATTDQDTWLTIGSAKPPQRGAQWFHFPRPMILRRWRLMLPGMGYFAVGIFRFYGPGRPVEREDRLYTLRCVLGKLKDIARTMSADGGHLAALTANIAEARDVGMPEEELEPFATAADELEADLREVAVEVEAALTGETLCTITITGKTSVAQAKEMVAAKAGIPESRQALVVADREVRSGSAALMPRPEPGSRVLLAQREDRPQFLPPVPGFAPIPDFVPDFAHFQVR